MNTVQLIGRLTRDVDLRHTQNGDAVGNFSLAVNRDFKNQQGDREADFIQCTIWRKAAENLANFTRKGSLIGVSGQLRTLSYDNQQGQRVYVTEVNVDKFDLLEKRPEVQGQPAQAPQQGYTNPYTRPDYTNQAPAQQQPAQSPFMDEGHPIDISEDDLPF